MRVLVQIMHLVVWVHTHVVLARVVHHTSRIFDIPPILAISVMAKESTFHPDARSDHGDLGLMQIRRGITTHGYDWMTDTQLMEPKVNIHLGVRRLARARRVCGGKSADWLGGYAGLSCGPSKYAQKVLGVLDILTAEPTAMWVSSSL